uniref:Cytochrome c oxidase subunit 2 n=1 Tax=Trouessartia rubecula TaxID=474308 RepID=A0A451G5Q0_9ACAR|nr:cytochrome c oxidase subunit II [Trouessartia rubecula]QAB47265.1 cytochrome c oxidase subunit 2 [Trouessartia rubecula]
MGELSVFHDHVIVVMSGVIVLIVYVMSYLLLNTKYYKNLSEGTMIEMIWSIVPAFLLIILVMPSMKVLYYMEDVKSPSLTFKVIAHQWYWSYVVPLYKNFSYLLDGKFFGGYEYDSLLEDDSMSPRLLGCSSDLVIPLGVTSRLLISSTDVIHSFAVPVMGLKVDAMPGRINQLFVNPSRMGVFYGQCSEICGSNHSFMPIILKVFNLSNYDSYTKNLLMELVEENVSSLSLNI